MAKKKPAYVLNIEEVQPKASPDSDFYKLSDEEYYNRYGQTKGGAYNVATGGEEFAAEAREKEAIREQQEVAPWYEKSWAAVKSSPFVSALRINSATLGAEGYDANPFQFDGGEKDGITEDTFTGYEDYLQDFATCRSKAEIDFKKERIDAVRHDRFLAQYGAGIMQQLSNAFFTIDNAALMTPLGWAGRAVGIATKAGKIGKVASAIGERYLGGGRFASALGKGTIGAIEGGVVGGAFTGMDVAALSTFTNVDDAWGCVAQGALAGAFLGGSLGTVSGYTAKNRKLIDQFVKEVNAVDPNDFTPATTAKPAQFYAKLDPGMRMATSSNAETRAIGEKLCDTFIQYEGDKGLFGMNPVNVEATARTKANIWGHEILQTHKSFDEFCGLKDNPFLHKYKQVKRNFIRDNFGYGKEWSRYTSGLSKALRNGDDASALSFLGYTEDEIAIIGREAKRLRPVINKIAQEGIDTDVYGLKAAAYAEFDEKIAALKAEREVHVKSYNKVAERIKSGKSKAAKADKGMLNELTGTMATIDKSITELEAGRKALEGKRFTVEDFKNVGDKSYLPRVYNRTAIQSNPEGFRRAVEAGLKAKNPGLTTEQLKDISSLVYDNIMHYNKGHTGGALAKAKSRRYEKFRSLDIDSQYIEDFLENDAVKLLIDYSDGIAADSELMRTFGTYNAEEMAKRVSDSWEPIIKKATDKNLANKLVKERDNEMDAVYCVVNRIRHYFDNTPGKVAAGWRNLSQFVRNINCARYLGGTAITSITDVGTAIANAGYKNLFSSALKLVKSRELRKSVHSEAFMHAIDRYMGSRQCTLEQEITGGGLWGSVLHFTKGLANTTVSASFIRKWDSMLKTISGYAGMEGIVRGTFTPQKLRQLGLSDEIVQRIRQQVNKHGRIDKTGVHANTEAWDDILAKTTLQDTISKLQEMCVLTPSAGSVPAIFDSAGAAPFLQFKRFCVTAYSKCLIPMLQTHDANVFHGMTMMAALASFKECIKASLAGRDIEPDKIIDRAIAGTDFVSFFPDLCGDIRHFFGDNAHSTWDINRNIVADIGGPAGSFAQDMYYLGGSIGDTFRGKELNKQQRAAIRRLIPLNNVVWLRWIFDKAERR